MKSQVFERAMKTFVEAFIPSLVTALAAADYTDLDTLPRVMIAVILSAVATGISAVWNGIIEPMLHRNDPFVESSNVVDWEEIEKVVDQEMSKNDEAGAVDEDHR